MNKMKILAVLFILIHFSASAQDYMGNNITYNFENTIKFQINEDSTVNLTYDDGSHYAEYDGIIQQLNDTTFHVSAKEIINKSGMKALSDDTSIVFRLDKTILENPCEVSIIYSNGTSINCRAYFDVERDCFEIPINKNLYNENEGKDFYYLTIDHINRITGNILKFKIEYGSDVALYTGENIDFNIIISNDYLYSVDYINTVLGKFRLNKVVNEKESYTFQGEIVGVSPFLLHLKDDSGMVTGFYKYLSDSLIVPLKGTLDSEGNLVLTGTEKSFPTFSGKLQNQFVQGSFVSSKKASPHMFYAVNPRGEYSNYNYNHIGITLASNGYIAEDQSRDKKGFITTHIQEDGRIYLSCDSLNAKLHLNGDTLRVEPLDSLQPFVFDSESPVFIYTDSFYNSLSFMEFPEKSEYYIADGKLMKLNDSCSVRMRHISRSEYIIRKWESAHLKNEPYKAIKNIKKARKMLGKRLREIEVKEEDFTRHSFEITFKDGLKRLWDGYDFKYAFVAYYPELDVLLLVNEADGDEPIDLNDSANNLVGNPSFHTESPDRQWRIAGYWPGGAADGMEYFIEKWNGQKRKYELAAELSFRNENESFYFSYTSCWFWSAAGKALFKIPHWEDAQYYEMEISTK